jgi:hypothetical protein
MAALGLLDSEGNAAAGADANNGLMARAEEMAVGTSDGKETIVRLGYKMIMTYEPICSFKHTN